MSTVAVLNEVVSAALTAADSRFRNAVQMISSRSEVDELLRYDQYIDLMIPRGSNRLVRYIKENTRIPVLGHADGLCHTYVDAGADLKKALRVTVDAKCQYAAACNATETLLVHRSVAHAFLPELKNCLDGRVELRGCHETLQIIDIASASETDWDEEYNDLILSVKIVGSVEEAVAFIFDGKHGGGGVFPAECRLGFGLRQLFHTVC